MKITAIAIALCLALPSLHAQDMIGLNFSVADSIETELAPDAVAGLQECEQIHWNNLPGPFGNSRTVVDSNGAELKGMDINWEVPSGGENAWRSKLGQSWGFKGNNLTLQRGYIQVGGSLTISGIPYAKYDVIVYLNADNNGGNGEVRITSHQGEIAKDDTYYYAFTWLGGQFTKAVSTQEESPEKANCAVFTGNSAKEITVEWKGNLSGGWTGVSGVQIVESH